MGRYARDAMPDGAARAAWLTAKRNLKMARSPHAFVRGSTAKFYEWLAEDSGKTICQGPSVWICGDCHAGNLGPVGSTAGNVAILIRDLDQTVIGNPALDLIRLGLSLATIARNSTLPGIFTTRMLEALLRGYLKGLSDPGPESTDIAPQIHMVFRNALSRRWNDLAKEHIGDSPRCIPLGSNFWPLSDAQRTGIEELMGEPAVAALITSLRKRKEKDAVVFRDAAYWVKGCSSLGLGRYAVLADIGRRGSCLIDVKEAIASVAPAAAGAVMPENQAERVLTGAIALSPALGERMAIGSVKKESVFIRELLPQDLKLDIERFSEEAAGAVAFLLASVLGQSHGRQLNRTDRRAWASMLRSSHPKTLEAPSWLWTAIVKSIARHETAYLGHCRRYASLSDAA